MEPTPGRSSHSGAPVFLVRHGESEWNVARLTQGQTAHPALTERGREQARRAAEQVAAELPVGSRARVISSDLVRAVQTAEIVAERLGAEVSRDPRLREQHLGELEGRGYEETWAAAEAHDWSDPSLPVAGGESPARLHARIREVLAEIATPEAPEISAVPVVLVSHGDAIRAAVAHLDGYGPGRGPWTEVPNGAVLRIDDRLRKIGDVARARMRAQ